MKRIETILCIFLLPVVASIPVFAAVIELPEIINPDSITAGNDLIYITDFPSVYIYSLKDYRLIKKFGRKGEGPKEWLRYTLLSLHENDLVISGQNKMLFFSITGEYIKEIKAKSIIYWGVGLRQTGSLPKTAPRKRLFSRLSPLFYILDAIYPLFLQPFNPFLTNDCPPSPGMRQRFFWSLTGLIMSDE